MSRIRTIKPTFFTDYKTGTLTPHAKILFAGLWVFSDDFGVCTSNIHEIKATIFPYDSLSADEAVAPYLDEIYKKGLISYFTSNINNTRYIFIKNFCAHQRVDRPGKPIINNWERGDTPEIFNEKYPDVLTIEGSDSTNVRRIFDEHSTIIRTGREGKGKELYRSNQDIISVGAEPLCDSAQNVPIFDEKDSAEEIFIKFPLISKDEFPIYKTQIENWKIIYPAVDIEQQVRECYDWNICHPTRRKTKRGILSHISKWLASEQDKGGRVIKFQQGGNYATNQKPIESIAERAKRQREEIRAKQRADAERQFTIDNLPERTCLEIAGG